MGFFHTLIPPRHSSNFTSRIPLCSHVSSLPYQDRCNFILTTPECHAAVHYFDYLNFIYCTVGLQSQHVYICGILLVCIFCLYLFTILATTADRFFCPGLAVISKMLKMSENLAGVTLLAFGNGSPDIFASLSNVSGDTELMYTELIGAAVFVTGFVAGIIILIRPFKIVGRNYVRDVLFFIVAALVMNYNINDQGYTLLEGFGTVSIYLLYIAYVICDHLWVKRKIEKLKQSVTIEEPEEVVKEILKEAEDLEESSEIAIHRRDDSSIILDEEITQVMKQKFGGRPNKDLFKTFVHSLNPVENWSTALWLEQVLMTLKAPIVFILLLIIPIVDYGEERHGWSKLLNMLHIITLPQLLLAVTGYISLMFFHAIPLSLIVLLISLGLSCAVFFTSRNDCPPTYHVTFAAGSFVGSICVIYTVAKEVVSVMKTLGVISDMTDSMVGLSILAWGNSIGDLFSNVSLAKQGYQKMAFAACFGGPLLNSLLGVGLTFIAKALKSPNNLAFTREGAMGPNCIIFLILILSATLFMLAFTNFHARKSTGIFMIIIYSLFILYALLGEFNHMHPYGTDHQRT